MDQERASYATDVVGPPGMGTIGQVERGKDVASAAQLEKVLQHNSALAEEYAARLLTLVGIVMPQVLNLVNRGEDAAVPPRPENFHGAMEQTLENLSRFMKSINTHLTKLEDYFGGR